MNVKWNRRQGKKAFFLSIIFIFSVILSSCGDSGGTKKVKLDPKNPTIVTVWHYYNGAILSAFDSLINDFNETVGKNEGIIVEGYGLGNLSELEKAVIAAANKEVGSMQIPNIFASYADTAYSAEKLEILANLDDYFSKDEQQQYLDSYIEEGKIGLNGELRIFPIAKSTEIFMINDTDWLPFADENDLTYDDLQTFEDITTVAELYYEWTDSLTPNIPNDGKAFYGRDSMANLFIIASKEFNTEIFQVENGTATINVNDDVMRKIWDNYYIPYISGYFTSYGRYRSDDAKVGDILAYVGSTSSASYFPNEVTVDGKTYPVESKIFPAPHFKGGKNVMVQQGAGMVVSKSTPQKEYASVLFLKWFTEIDTNIEFSALSGYMPVKKEAVKYDTLISSLNKTGRTLDYITDETLSKALSEIAISELYTNKAFSGGAAARAVLDRSLHDKAVADRSDVIKLLESGSTHQQAVATYDNDANFNTWLQTLKSQLVEAAK